MARIEKTVFISYRRKDISWALAVYQYLTSQNYDAFFDYTHIPSGDFEQIIVSNIKARAHFILILTPDALDRTSNEGDWLRREIETAIDEKRNIIPLFFDGFSFGSPNVKEKLSGKLADISRYNGLDIPSGYFPEAMERLSKRYLNVSLDAVLHPLSLEVHNKVEEEKVAVNKALREQKTEINELLQSAQEKAEKPKGSHSKKTRESASPDHRDEAIRVSPKSNILPFAIGGSILLVALCIWGGVSLWNNLSSSIPDPTRTLETAEKEEPQPTKTDTPTPIVVLDIGSTKIGSDGMTLLYVPAGEFTMGSEIFDDEKPAHTVYLDAYWIDKTEVTNSLFAIFLNQIGNQTDGGVTWLDSNDLDARIQFDGGEWRAEAGYGDHPVIEVSWFGAKSYCSWVERRLPTEAEWEKAARGTNMLVYPWGNTFDASRLNFCDKNCTSEFADNNADDGNEFTSRVGIYSNGASPYGALDMAGNVWEWVSDWYEEDYYNVSPLSNPQGPTSGERRVLRGGSWYFGSDVARTANRDWGVPDDSNSSFGFRCVMDAE